MKVSQLFLFVTGSCRELKKKESSLVVLIKEFRFFYNFFLKRDRSNICTSHMYFIVRFILFKILYKQHSIKYIYYVYFSLNYIIYFLKNYIIQFDNKLHVPYYDHE